MSWFIHFTLALNWTKFSAKLEFLIKIGCIKDFEKMEIEVIWYLEQKLLLYINLSVVKLVANVVVFVSITLQAESFSLAAITPFLMTINLQIVRQIWLFFFLYRSKNQFPRRIL